MKKLSICLFALVLLTVEGRCGELEDRVLNVSVTVRADRGTGSGTLFVNGEKTYVLTAGHVVASLREVNKVSVEKDGTVKEVEKITWQTARIVNTVFQDKKEVGESTFNADVIAYSPAEESGGFDIAILELSKKNFAKTGARYIPKDNSLELGDDIIHIGSLYGDFTGSLIKGNISRFDYKYKGKSFMCANLGSKPGSSGGGVFVKQGDKYVYCGMLVRGDGSGLALLKPTDVIRKFVKEQGLEVLLEDK